MKKMISGGWRCPAALRALATPNKLVRVDSSTWLTDSPLIACVGSLAMRRTIETLRGRFDRILLDMPPVTPLADASILSPMVDGVLLIVRAGVTPKPAIERALTGFDASKLLGLVLNEASETDVTKYGMDYVSR